MTSDGSAAPVFPGATSVSELEVYDGVAPDGLAGGTPHLHVASAEAYLVIAGRGRLHTIDGSGFAEHPLEPGSLVWFQPGVWAKRCAAMLSHGNGRGDPSKAAQAGVTPLRGLSRRSFT